MITRQRVMALGGTLLLGGLGWWWSTQPTPANAPTTTPARPTSINALGRLEPATAVLGITAAAGLEGGRLARLFVEEGDRVNAGQPLFTLDSASRLRSAVAQAEAETAAAQGRLAQVRAGAKRADVAAQEAATGRLAAELRQAEALERRAEALLRTGDVARKEWEARQTNAEALRHELERARRQQEALTEVRPADVTAAQAEIASAQAAAARARADLANAMVRSPIAGTVLRIYNRPGEAASNKVLELADTTRMRVVAEVYESDIRRVRVGQPATITLPALRETLRGTVERIGQQVSRRETVNLDPVAETDARVVRVHIALDEAASRRAAGLINMQVDVRIAL